MQGPFKDTRLRFGRVTLIALGFLFMVYSVATAATPLLAEEEYAGTSFKDLQSLNPKLASIIWHDHLGFGILNFAGSLLVVILAWKGLSRSSSLAWYSLLILGVTSLAFLLLSHLPIGSTHFVPGLIPNVIYFVALAISRPDAKRETLEPAAHGATRIGWMIVFAIGLISMFYSVIMAATPLLGEEEYVGTTFTNLKATYPKLANIIWHDAVAFGTITFGASFVAVILSWKGLSRGSVLSWFSLLILGVALLVGIPLAHFPIGNTSFTHIGPGSILLAIFLIALAISAKPLFSRKEDGNKGS